MDIKESNKKYYQEHKEEQKERVLKWQKEHPEKCREIQEKYRNAHKEELSEKIRERNKTPEYKQYMRNYMRGYIKNHPENLTSEQKEKNREKVRNYQRKHYLGGKSSKEKRAYNNLNKRNYPKDNKCELCNKKPKKLLFYHHWDEKNPSKGIWACWHCHMLVEQYERDNLHLIQRYLRFKKQINKEFKKRPKQLELKGVN